MQKKSLAGLAAGMVLLAVSAPLFGHHNSIARYDQEHPLTMEGTVLEFRMISPHARIILEVKGENGEAVHWDTETSSPAALYRRGWRTDMLKPGDRITVTGKPAVDGSHSLELIKVVAPGGKVLE